MKPIPKNLLIHSAELISVSEKDQWQEEHAGESKHLEKIRIEPISRLVTAKDNRQITLSALLIYDCRNSRPKNIQFEQGQKVMWNGIEHVIETIESLYDGGRLHHYELGLI